MTSAVAPTLVLLDARFGGEATRARVLDWAAERRVEARVLVDADVAEVERLARDGIQGAIVGASPRGEPARGAAGLPAAVAAVVVQATGLRDEAVMPERARGTWSLRISGRGEKGYLWALRHLVARSAWRATSVRFGESAEHVGDLRLPKHGNGHPVVVIFHGGFWREPFTRDMMEGVAVALAQRGFATWNVEFRRVGASAGGYPTTLADAARALDAVADVAVDAGLDLGRVALLGHSAGGHLALVTASEVARAHHAAGGRVAPRAVVAMAPISNLALARAARLGEGAVEEMLGGHEPADAPFACPARQLPLRVPQMIVHGADDETVPLDHSARYVVQARGLGDAVTLMAIPGAGHMAPTDPFTEAGRAAVDGVAAWLGATLGGP